MVDVSEALESKYLTADLAKESPSKTIVIVSEGKYENTDFGNRLTITVSLDMKEKIWRPNRDSVRNLSNQFGTDTKSWVGKKATLQIISIQGKDSVIATGV